MSDISLEDICIQEGLDFKTSSGARGQQIILHDCPKCGNSSWKVYANAESSLGNCFSCSRTFNLFKFAGWLLEARGVPHDNRSIGNYLNETRKLLGYRPKAKPVVKIAIETDMPFELPASAALPYEDGWNHPYLLKRGISAAYAKQFQLRFSAYGSNTYKNDKGEEVRQSFADRIIIPVFDLDGTLVTYQGRDTTGLSDTRYRFAGGLPGTGRYLYNGHVAKALRARSAVMCEGPMDVIGVQKAVDGAHDLSQFVPVGSFGKHLSKQNKGDDQITAFSRLKQSGLQEVVIMWDAEKEAYNAAIDASMLLTKIGLVTRLAILPKGQDPGDADASVICDAIRKATPINRITSLRLRMNNPFA